MHYQARDMARRARQPRQVPGRSWRRRRPPSSATSMRAPGRYAHVLLPGRYSGAELPEVDHHRHAPQPPEHGKWLSPPLVTAIAETLGRSSSRCCFSTAAVTPR